MHDRSSAPWSTAPCSLAHRYCGNERPIAPTDEQDYLQQLVIVGDPIPNTFETIAYAAQLPWMPFTRSASAYVIINADLDGTITDID